ncbi:MAG: alpha/beta fold hydrolase, partial [Oscillospiraceae bacterium]|nr:alpha/beta fold hydrolase [Oscillospiraceae bacterium]
MQKYITTIILSALFVALTACGVISDSDRSAEEATADVQSRGYQTETVTFARDGKTIYGELLLPESSGPHPVVVIAHGFGGNLTQVSAYAEAFVENGIAAYAFDFIGGGRGSRSDGKMVEMSVLTEAADMNAVLDGLLAREDIDPENIFLLGGSQGGFVATYVAGTRPEDVKGLVALYPAYVLQDDAWQRTPDPNDIPETMNLMGSTIGRIYNEDAMSFDIYDLMDDYPREVLIIHGTNDNIAPISYSERAVTVFPSAELVKIEGAGHGFYGANEAHSAQLAVDVVKGVL